MLNNDWAAVVAICAIPFLIFGAAEFVGLLRRRQYEAIARRRKS